MGSINVRLSSVDADIDLGDLAERVVQEGRLPEMLRLLGTEGFEQFDPEDIRDGVLRLARDPHKRHDGLRQLLTLLRDIEFPAGGEVAHGA